MLDVAPGVREFADEKQATAVLAVRVRGLGGRSAGAGVAYFDAYLFLGCFDPYPEQPAWWDAVQQGIGGGQGDAWGEDAAARGRRGTQRVLHAGEVSAPAVVARLLGLEDGDTVVVRRRIRYLDEEPCELTDPYYPAQIAAGTGLAGTAKIRGGAVALLAELGHVGRVPCMIAFCPGSSGEAEGGQGSAAVAGGVA